MARMSKLPDGYGQCQWCKYGVKLAPDGAWPVRCPGCNLHPHPGGVDETVGGKVDPEKAKTSKRNVKGAARQTEFSKDRAGTPVLGMDPGAKYTGIVLRDGDWLGFSTCLVRPEGMDPVAWMRSCVNEVKFILIQHCPPETKKAIEGVVAPRGFKDGKKAPINPGFILMAGVVMGGLAAQWPEAEIIPPGGNGSQHITHYHPGLVGRRPDWLPGDNHGAGTRDHEQSAWDVAGRATAALWPREIPDMRRLMGVAD